MTGSAVERPRHGYLLGVDQQVWLADNRDAARAALNALVQEPVSRSQARQLRRLIDSLEVDAAADAAELSGGELDEPAMTEGDRSTDSAFGRLLMTVSQPNQERPFLRFIAGLVYPLAVLGFAAVVLIATSLFLVPTFEQMFNDFGLMLPAPTMLLIAISRMVRFSLWFWGPALILAIVASYFASRFIGRLLDQVGLSRRGSIRKLIGMSRLCRGLIVRLETGLSTPEALRMAKLDTGDAFLEAAADDLADALEQHRYYIEQRLPAESVSPFDAPENASFDATLAEAWTPFPANLMIALVGEHRGSTRPNVPMLQTLADMYDERAVGRTEIGSTFFAMLTVLIIGIFVLFAMLALFMPLLELITGLS